MSDKDIYVAERLAMVENQIHARGICDSRVLNAMKTVPRHRFTSWGEKGHVLASPYGDYPLGIGYGQTISQPYIVAYMTAQLHIAPGDRVLEVGTGCGYQTAVLCEMGATVFSIERISELADMATEILLKLGYGARICVGDGYSGLADDAPFDAIICAAAAKAIPPSFETQLKAGGRMVLPVGQHFQELKTLVKKGDELVEIDSLPVRFVPLVHEN